MVAQFDGIIGSTFQYAKFGFVEANAGEDFVFHTENKYGFVKGKILSNAGKRQAIFTEFFNIHSYLAFE